MVDVCELGDWSMQDWKLGEIAAGTAKGVSLSLFWSFTSLFSVSLSPCYLQQRRSFSL